MEEFEEEFLQEKEEIKVNYDMEFKKKCNILSINRIESNFTNKYKREYLPSNELKMYNWYLNSKSSYNYIMYASGSVCCTSLFVISRIPR